MRLGWCALLLAFVASCSGGDRPYRPDPTDDGGFVDATPIDAPDDGPSTLDAEELIDAPSRIDAAIDAPSRVDAGIDAPSGPVTVTVAVVGRGLVVSNPAGIRCEPTCTATFPPGTVVTLTAVPAAGWTFAGWSNGCTGAGTCIPGSSPVTAIFTQNQPTCVLGAEVTGAGQVVSSPAGINCGPDCRESYPCGTVVTLTALASPGGVFLGWSGPCAGAAGVCTVAVSDPLTIVRAAFR